MGVLLQVDTSSPATNGSNTGPRTIRSWAPATGDLLGEVRVSSRDEVLAAVGRAKKAQAAWGVLPIEESLAASVASLATTASPTR